MEVQSVRAESPEDSKRRIKQLAETWSRRKGGSCEKSRDVRLVGRLLVTFSIQF
jgi:hypothetical protein